jgi:putative colanic acid biosynthesis acetyltransferase WcaF
MKDVRSMPVPIELRRFEADMPDRGRQALWFAVSGLVFEKWSCPRRLRPALLRGFGASVGRRVVVRERVFVLKPWLLELGDDVWIGRGTTVINHATVTVSHDVCVSQEAFVCSSGHDPHDWAFSYKHAPISIGAHSWLGARAVLFPGVALPERALVPGGTTVRPER